MVYFEICLLQLIGDLFIVIGLIGNVFSVISSKNGSQTFQNTEGTIKNGQSRETGNIRVHNTQDEEKQNKNITQYLLNTTQANSNNVDPPSNN